MKKTISLCMIVKNEEQYLENCLKSVSNFVDELIIVDTGSVDSTIEIAKQFTENVFHFNWNNDFSKARNFSIKKATSDFILILDADEVISNPSRLLDLSNDVDIYTLSIQNFQSNGSNYVHYANRIFKNNNLFKFNNRLHEQLNIKDFENIVVKKMEILIYHYGYLSENEVKQDKRRRNFNLIKVEVDEHPNPYNFYNLGREYFLKRDYEKALNQFKHSMRLSHTEVFTPDLINKMAHCLLNLNYFNEGITVLKNGIKLYPYETEMYFTISLLYSHNEEFRSAKKYLEKCIEMGDSGYQKTEGLGGYISYSELSKIEMKLGNIKKSIFFIQKAIKINKKYVPALIQMLSVINVKFSNPIDKIIFIEKNYIIETKGDLTTLIEILYNTRDVLLGYFLRKYNINVEPRVIGVANLLECNYVKSFMCFEKINIIEDDNFRDIFCLYFLTKSSDKFKNIKFKNIDYNKKIFLAIIQREKNIFVENKEDREILIFRIKEVQELLIKMNCIKSKNVLDSYLDNLKSK